MGQFVKERVLFCLLVLKFKSICMASGEGLVLLQLMMEKAKGQEDRWGRERQEGQADFRTIHAVPTLREQERPLEKGMHLFIRSLPLGLGTAHSFSNIAVPRLHMNFGGNKHTQITALISNAAHSMYVEITFLQPRPFCTVGLHLMYNKINLTCFFWEEGNEKILVKGSKVPIR